VFLGRQAGTDISAFRAWAAIPAEDIYGDELASFNRDDVAAARELIERDGDLGIGMADASIVVLAGKLDCRRILTLDERHFRALRTPSGKPFTLLPADA
jgi:predicted nucleic acid-binding protein